MRLMESGHGRFVAFPAVWGAGGEVGVYSALVPQLLRTDRLGIWGRGSADEGVTGRGAQMGPQRPPASLRPQQEATEKWCGWACRSSLGWPRGRSDSSWQFHGPGKVSGVGPGFCHQVGWEGGLPHIYPNCADPSGDLAQGHREAWKGACSHLGILWVLTVQTGFTRREPGSQAA